MKKERVFRPPQTVLDTVARFDGDPSIVKLNSSAIPLSDLRKMNAFLQSSNVIAKGDDWDHQGGNAGLMWSRRVLRQEGIIKASTEGDALIPDAIDIQLGPTIIAGFTKEEADPLAEKFSEAGIPASIISTKSGTVAFWAGEAQKNYDVSKGLISLPNVELSDITMIDESRGKLVSIYKTAQNGTAAVDCQLLAKIPTDIEASWDKVYLLKSSPSQQARVIKVDDELGLVLGWAIICTVEDEPYFDKQGDYIPDGGMLEASSTFMQDSRVAKEMHVGDERGTIVFAWPMTAEIAKAFDIEVQQTGLMIAMKPDNEEMLEKFRDGTYQGFSIGGTRIAEFTEEVE